ncbi:HMA2 domain-containing protein [Shewanella intestini]|uniref:Uncharacterized protein n=1 Tax=Shewanella intestini TaxID=2017544 RepID=A0ABS5I459_9GAMM|nr:MULTISPECIES: hypothetical protein [Shewanella]MBR9728807.1 hypothetical protein [Shewanella intestini]MRG36882.1 hypothetical protein [Shewanella sp. XMDDZSB0408]
MNCYVHKTQQRLRVRSEFIRENKLQVCTLIEQLELIDAVKHVKHQQYAGSVAITFDNKELDCDSLLEILESHGWLVENNKPSFVETAVTTGTKTFVKGVAGIALSRLVGPAVSKMIMSAA